MYHHEPSCFARRLASPGKVVTSCRSPGQRSPRGYADQIEWRQFALRESESFAQGSLPAIASHGVANFTRNCETQSRMAEAVGNAAQPEKMVRHAMASIEDTTKVRRFE